LCVGDRLVRPMLGVPWLEHHGIFLGKKKVIPVQNIRDGRATVRISKPSMFAMGHVLRVEPRGGARAGVAAARNALRCGLRGRGK